MTDETKAATSLMHRMKGGFRDTLKVFSPNKYKSKILKRGRIMGPSFQRDPPGTPPADEEEEKRARADRLLESWNKRDLTIHTDEMEPKETSAPAVITPTEEASAVVLPTEEAASAAQAQPKGEAKGRGRHTAERAKIRAAFKGKASSETSNSTHKEYIAEAPGNPVLPSIDSMEDSEPTLEIANNADRNWLDSRAPNQDESNNDSNHHHNYFRLSRETTPPIFETPPSTRNYHKDDSLSELVGETGAAPALGNEMTKMDAPLTAVAPVAASGTPKTPLGDTPEGRETSKKEAAVAPVAASGTPKTLTGGTPNDRKTSKKEAAVAPDAASGTPKTATGGTPNDRKTSKKEAAVAPVAASGAPKTPSGDTHKRGDITDSPDSLIYSPSPPAQEKGSRKAAIMNSDPVSSTLHGLGCLGTPSELSFHGEETPRDIPKEIAFPRLVSDNLSLHVNDPSSPGHIASVEAQEAQDAPGHIASEEAQDVEMAQPLLGPSAHAPWTVPNSRDALVSWLHAMTPAEALLCLIIFLGILKLLK